jgi:hypothetical protein
VKVYEDGLDNQAVGVDRLLGEAWRATANLREFAVFDPDIAAETRNARPIDDRSALDVNIVLCHSGSLLDW